ncbi:hypothetical protein BKA93DRAFT_380265 [Sparassis latifolia]
MQQEGPDRPQRSSSLRSPYEGSSTLSTSQARRVVPPSPLSNLCWPDSDPSVQPPPQAAPNPTESVAQTFPPASSVSQAPRLEDSPLVCPPTPRLGPPTYPVRSSTSWSVMSGDHSLEPPSNLLPRSTPRMLSAIFRSLTERDQSVERPSTPRPGLTRRRSLSPRPRLSPPPSRPKWTYPPGHPARGSEPLEARCYPSSSFGDLSVSDRVAPYSFECAEPCCEGCSLCEAGLPHFMRRDRVSRWRR